MLLNRLIGGPLVEFVEFDRGLLVFQARKRPEPGLLQLRLRDGSGRRLRIHVKVEGSRPTREGNFICHGRVENPQECRQVAQIGGPTVPLGESLRQAPRLPCNRDIELDDGQVAMVDFSTGGARIASAQSLASGQIVTLGLTSHLQCEARVAWTAVIANVHLAGLQFQNLRAGNRELLRLFERSLRARPDSGQRQPASGKKPAQARPKACSSPSPAESPMKLPPPPSYGDLAQPGR